MPPGSRGYTCEGSGLVRVGAEELEAEAGSAVFIPGDVPHSCENTGASELRVAYVFPADSFDEVEYVFENRARDRSTHGGCT